MTPPKPSRRSRPAVTIAIENWRGRSAEGRVLALRPFINVRMTKNLGVYLAGPGVFRPDAQTFGEAMKELARDYGLTGLWPLDNAVSDDDPAALARKIFEANVAMIDAAVAIVADISPFRGPYMDPGTAFEIGYAHACGKPIFAWTSDPRTLHARTEAQMQGSMHSLHGTDAQGWTIENFGLIENLMIAVPARGVYDTAELAIEAAARYLME